MKYKSSNKEAKSLREKTSTIDNFHRSVLRKSIEYCQSPTKVETGRKTTRSCYNSNKS